MFVCACLRRFLLSADTLDLKELKNKSLDEFQRWLIEQMTGG